VNSRGVTFKSFRRLPRRPRHAEALAQAGALAKAAPLSFADLGKEILPTHIPNSQFAPRDLILK
jgi:hypothetical protein